VSASASESHRGQQALAKTRVEGLLTILIMLGVEQKIRAFRSEHHLSGKVDVVSSLHTPGGLGLAR
jgi:hypothetical protein